MSELPPLPEQTHFPGWADIAYYTADQMRTYAEAYAAAKVAQERERIAERLEGLGYHEYAHEVRHRR